MAGSAQFESAPNYALKRTVREEVSSAIMRWELMGTCPINRAGFAQELVKKGVEEGCQRQFFRMFPRIIP